MGRSGCNLAVLGPLAPLMQNAPCVEGCSGLPVILSNRSSSTCISDPQRTLHSLHVLAMIRRVICALLSCNNKNQPRDECLRTRNPTLGLPMYLKLTHYLKDAVSRQP